MGIAAHRRGDAVIARGCREGLRQAQAAEERQRLAQALADVAEWRRSAWGLFVDARAGDGQGLAARAIKDAGGRVFDARMAKVVKAQAAWVDCGQRGDLAELTALIAWAQAVHRLLDWSRGSFRLAVLDSAPRSVIGK